MSKRGSSGSTKDRRRQKHAGLRLKAFGGDEMRKLVQAMRPFHASFGARALSHSVTVSRLPLMISGKSCSISEMMAKRIFVLVTLRSTSRWSRRCAQILV